MKKVLALFLALMMVLSLFTACAKQETTTTAEPTPAETETEAEQTTEEAPAASGEDIVINFLGAQYSDKTEPYLKQVCADFEAANPGIKVNLEIVGWDNISSRATALVGAGQAPDIYNGGSASEYVPDGLLYNVKDIVSEELQADFYPSFLDNNRDIDDGEVYAVPYLASVRALYCNAKIFKEVGIENPPKTWTEVEEACQKINDFYNGDVYAWGIDATTTEGQTMVAYYEALGDKKSEVTNLTSLERAEAEYQQRLTNKRQTALDDLKKIYDAKDTKGFTARGLQKLKEAYEEGVRNINNAGDCKLVESSFNAAAEKINKLNGKDITVTFRLIGALQATQDVNLTKDSYLPEYVTWIPTTSYDLQEDATVYDLYTKAIGEAGLRSIGEENDYVRTIYAPSCLGGYALSEFTNGARSGWMYTVNGTHPDRGLKNWKLKDGDVVVWHYINDYAHEAADWFDDPDYPALGDGTYYNGWLRAADISPEQYVQQLLGKILKVGKNGTVEPKLTLSHIGRSVTFTFKPDKGYHVKDVKVDGKSVGAVTTYTVDKLTVSTRIEVEFTNGVLPFTDVREADWFYDDVVYAYENGLFSGTSDTTFSPNASMTRAMLVTVLYRLEGQPTVSGRSGFSDVKLNSYYEDAVTWAADNGIVNGTGATTFSPNANVTREQMAAILYRYAQYKQYGTTASAGLNGFSDAAKVSTYAKAPLSWAFAEKLVNGSEGRLLPTGNATRAQVAAILHRFVENVAKTTA